MAHLLSARSLTCSLESEPRALTFSPALSAGHPWGGRSSTKSSPVGPDAPKKPIPCLTRPAASTPFRAYSGNYRLMTPETTLEDEVPHVLTLLAAL